jgi:Zn-dependent M28 family amino/carboxypeptidase
LGSAIEKGIEVVKMRCWELLSWGHCKGLVRYDHDTDCYDMVPGNYMPLPTIFVNKTEGKEIYDNVDNFTINFTINQNWDNSVDSYNVIGQINGTDPNKTVIICSLYDSWWCQGTADSAIGMAMVLALAKYYKQLKDDYNITPKYNLKFIAFGGEEYGFLGAYSYESRHNTENITAVVDLNQLGFYQPSPNLTFNIFTNDLLLKPVLNKINDITDYKGRSGDDSNFDILVRGHGAPSNDRAFAQNRSNSLCKTLCFVKTHGRINRHHRWVLHHRTNENHSEGDTMEYYDPDEVNVTAELVLNVTKYFTINPNCWFSSISHVTSDSNSDDNTFNDTVNVSYIVNTTMPSDRITIRTVLKCED